MERALATILQQGCKALGLEPDCARRELLLAYLALLEKWNGAYNLTSVCDPREMVIRHLLDSLAVSPWLRERRLIDVGSGAGLPGIPLAICAPQRQFHLLDSNGKKTRFLFHVKTALGLDNIEVHRARVESFRPAQPYDAVLSRAFASLQEIATCCRHLLAPGGRLLAMKGHYPAQELASVAGQCEILGVHPLEVPGLGERRHLVEMTMRRSAQQL